MSLRGMRETLGTLAVAAAVLLGASFAMAAPASPSPLIGIQIESVGPYDNYAMQAEGTPNGDGTYTLAGVGYGTNFTCDWSIVVNPDPFITGNFTLTNLSTLTQTFVLTVTLPVTPALPGPNVMGGYFGDLTYTDFNNSGAVTVATIGLNPFYSARIDGVEVMPLGSFSATATGSVPPGGVVGTINQHIFGAPIPSDPAIAVNTNISFAIRFSLTGNDRVSFPAYFEVSPVPAPEPSTLLLIGLGFAGLVAARKRS